MNETQQHHSLRRFHRIAIQEIASGRLGEDVDLIVMSSLVEMRMLAVRSGDSRLVLTECGQRVYQKLQPCGSRWSSGDWA